MSSGLIIGAVCLALGLIASGIGYIYVELKNNKAKNKEDKLSPTKKDLFDNSIAYKKLGIIKFKDWNKNSSGIVLAAGVYKSSSKINNKFVLKNLKKNFSRTKNLKKIDLEDLVITKSEQKSAVVIAPPGTGKTQALLLPTIVYNAYCKDKPNMIINWSLHFISKKSKRRQKSLLILIVCTLILIQKNECGISDKYVLRISILILQSFFWFLHITPRCWRIVFHSCHFIVILPY